jgi:hypothetical protein
MTPDQAGEDNGNGCKKAHNQRDYPFPFVRHVLSPLLDRLSDKVFGRIIAPSEDRQPKWESTLDAKEDPNAGSVIKRPL